ncbi:AraC family transcriptional regulator [Murimonas intestini]|uniref:AraC family transcriptional regulator n=1 Tax=Murimonas intestini TaxID=1337051 RepID=A0AB73TAS8_9FIRM|nr:AraC family transcriptional regulator [Murimonas intestini]MCR1864224.1 AraC family transcriptional regulator [Murimonas intestini]MCR1881834.1 AraC family transcriptional regulator [Murimonas intestini]
MEWTERLQTIIDYVEDHLQRKQEPLNQQEVSELAECSFDFFQKVFSYMNGTSFSEYIRSRKLTLAGYDLKSTDKRVVEISYQYGYDSPTSFTKAFQKFHGMTPKEARSGNRKLRVVPKMQISVKQQYFWRLEQKPAFRLVGKSIRCANGEQSSKIPEFWSECQKAGTFSQLISTDTGNPKGLFGLYRYGESSSKDIEYSIMVAANGRLPEGCSEVRIPESTWAVFDCRGAVPPAIQSGWKYLQEEWLVRYPFEHADCPELEWYSFGNSYERDYLSQIWIPVASRM